MIRITHLITDLGLGGAEVSLVKLVAGLDRSRFQSKIVSLIDDGPVAETVRAHQIPLVGLGFRRGKLSMRGLARLVTLLRQDRPAILQTWLYHADLLGLIAGHLARTPRIIWNIRCSDMTAEGNRRQFRLVLRTLARLSGLPDAVVVNSVSGRKFHESLGYRPRLWAEIFNGVDSGRFRPRPAERAALRSALGVPDGAWAIGLVARLDPMKDHRTFFAAAAEFLSRQPEAIFVVAGEGCTPDSQELKRIVAGLELEERIRLIGVRRDLENVYPALDVMTLSSAFGEGCPNVLIEAMSCGVPCVATDVGDCSRIIGPAGRIVPPRDPAALARAWEEILSGDLRSLGAAARTRAENQFDLERVRDAYEALYTNLALPNAAQVSAAAG